MYKWKINNKKYKKKIFKQINKLIKLKKYNKALFEIKKISFFQLDEVDINSLKKIIKLNYNLFIKNNTLRKIKVLFLSNHYLENFKYNLFLSGIEKNLFIDSRFGGLNQLNYNELSKNVKNDLGEFDLIIYSNFINYESNININKSFFSLKKNIDSIKKINPNILITDNPLISEKFTNQHLLVKYNFLLNKYCNKNKYFFWNTSVLQSKIGFKNFHDSKYFFDNKIFFNPRYSEEIFSNLASYLSFKFHTNIRLVVTDLDNTMWNGLAADDKTEEIDYLPGNSVGEPHYNYQLLLNELNNKNILIAAASKNEFKTVKKIFNEKKFPFKFDNFIDTKINWKPKSQNILEICKNTNLSPEYVLFIDDSKSEIFEVLENVPKINVLSFENSLEINSNIDSADYFMEFSGEKINRLKSIKTSKNLSQKINSKKAYIKYLKELKMKMLIRKVNNNSMNRFIELINKTNQFNLNLKRTNNFEIKKFLNNKNNLALTFQLSDKFIDHGIISNVMVSINKGEAKIDAFVISCRVFERKVEFYIMDKIVNILKKKKVKFVNSLFIRTDRNTQFQNYYDQLGFKTTKNKSNKKYYQLKINEYKKNNFYIK